MKSWKSIIQLLLMAVSVGCLICANMLSAVAQDDWSVIAVLFEPQHGWQDQATSMVADRTGNAHLVWLHTISGEAESAVYYYSRWNGTAWTVPVDIFAATSDLRLGWPVLVAASDGKLHIFWNSAYYIYHSWAWADNAEQVRSWMVPEVISVCEQVCSVPMDAKQDDAGVFHVIFAERVGNSYYTRSEDGGATWKSPIAVSSVSVNETAYLPRVSGASSGRIHAIWTELQLPDGPTLRVNYAYSDDRGSTWSFPLEVGTKFHSDGNVLSVGNSVVHLVWNGGVGAGGRYHQRSDDGGFTWSDPVVLSKAAGQSGYPSIAVDSTHGMHVLTGDGEYVNWDGGFWSQPLRHFPWDSEQSRLVVAGGNQLVVVSPLTFSGIRYTVKRLNAPFQKDVIPPTPISGSTLTPTETVGVVTATAAPTVASSGLLQEERSTQAIAPVFLGTVASIFVIILGLFVQRKYSGKS